ncbi:cysteine methyltransferase [Putridiphycobacter roseus]|uniref:Cysteine methyltransferase n=1 Tax=Putridiphycobacter roseus TaxID=2219161 RepID=A0A2W1NFT6_9FLAO|nr:MGMT family protein [Putridiphycobacter roseus]PZE16896.1 cysteine methyltransferase [Putridiphycobacter roseus]
MDKDFYQNIFDLVKVIPSGRVTSYGQIAKYLGAARSSRMVGWAMNLSHSQKEDIPAHRVVNRNGLLTGKMHFETPETMAALLRAEGVVVNGDQIENFKLVFWDPFIELG